MSAVSRKGQYTDEDKRRAMAVYTVLGNQLRTAEQTGIPRRTLHDWIKSSWGQDMITAIRHEKQDQFIAGYTNIIESALESVQERLSTGDYVGTGDDGNPVYKPLSARDSIMIAAISTDKMRLLSNQATTITQSDNVLTGIAAQLAQYAVKSMEQAKDCNVVATQDKVSD